jgi:hypothetical protein
MHAVFEYKQREKSCKYKQFLLTIEFEHELIYYYASPLSLYESMHCVFFFWEIWEHALVV